ncbi:MAG: ArsR/SmtB family transcription factor [bacterium]
MVSEGYFLKVLADDTRLKIIRSLKKKPYHVSDLAKDLQINKSAVSQHLRLLKQVDLVSSEREGRWVNYSINRDTLEIYGRRVAEICAGWRSYSDVFGGRQPPQRENSKGALEKYRRLLEGELRKVRVRLEAKESR